MYRLEKGKREIMLRFSRESACGAADREEICRMLLRREVDIEKIADSGSGILFHNRLGAVVLEAEQFPSFLFTVRSVVPKSAWFYE
ncbi:hypothetical protein DRW41_12840 [Neobacillus piezotolerans]|uniref:Uncharacterized protein n=1 Tax=Neobacillus piezotolerans TaxID=2259171 RepID=A0A3D8GQU5_9BACI|nr:hypothetical protein [Neobacillus piezotolerans]RDU36416.1 hypothetical protein DRW41_12840 [Neobacillus piezotolerans]